MGDRDQTLPMTNTATRIRRIAEEYRNITDLMAGNIRDIRALALYVLSIQIKPPGWSIETRRVADPDQWFVELKLGDEVLFAAGPMSEDAAAKLAAERREQLGLIEGAEVQIEGIIANQMRVLARMLMTAPSKVIDAVADLMDWRDRVVSVVSGTLVDKR